MIYLFVTIGLHASIKLSDFIWKTVELAANQTCHLQYFLCTKATLPIQKGHLLLLCLEALLVSADCLFSFPTE